jgi:predicted permease
MDNSFVFAVNAVSPILLTVVIGYILKKATLLTADLAKAINKLVFRVFLPVMLFNNIYKISDLGSFRPGYIIYSVVAIAVIFALCLVFVIFFTKDQKKRASILQGSFRANYALIGIPLAEALFGAEGVAVASILSAFTIPTFNIFAVISLSIFREGNEKPSVKKILLGIVKNPLIQGVAAGAVALLIRSLFVRFGIEFRLTDIEPAYKVITWLTNLASPLSLLVLGAQFEFSAVASLKREIISGVVIRNLIVPTLGLGIAYLFCKSFGGAEFASLVAVFATPIAVSSVPMAQEMDADATLSGQLVVWSTVFSAFSVFFSSMILHSLGVFV